MYLKDRAKFLHIEKKLATGELKVAEKDGGKKSNVWKHFDIVVKAEPGYFQHEPYVRCRACGIIMNYHSKKTGTSQMQRHSSRRCMRGFIGRPKDDANHPDFAPSQNLAHQAGLTCPVSSYEEGEDDKGLVKIKVEEDYEQMEEPLSGQDDPTEDQRRDDGRSPTSFTTNKLKEIGEQNRSSEITKESYSRHQTGFDADHAQTLGEILAYCQVMYGAIQKLDEKLQSLQAKVVHIEPVQLTTELFQKATSNAAQLLANDSMDLPVVNAVNESPVPNLPTVSMPELVRVCSPSPLSAAVKARMPPHLLPATREGSPVGLPDQGTAASSSSSVAATHSPHVKPIEGEEDTEVQPSEHSPPRRGSTKIVPSIVNHTGSERLGWVGDRKRNVCLSQGKMLKVQKMTKPSRAVRFLFRSLFSVEELQCSNTLGDQARGLKRLDPNKIAAIRVRRKTAEKNMPCVADLEELSTLSESTDEEEEIEDNPPEYEAAAAATTACAAVEKFLMEQVGELHLKMDHIIELLQSRHPGARDTDTILPMLPLATMDALHDFDWRLESDSTFRTQVINKLSLSGGKNIRETVWRVCSKAISQNLATQLNWCGRGQKTGLKSTPIHQVLLKWLSGRFPRCDLREKGRDWRKCVTVMNSTARYLRLMAKRRRSAVLIQTRLGKFFLRHKRLRPVKSKQLDEASNSAEQSNAAQRSSDSADLGCSEEMYLCQEDRSQSAVVMPAATVETTEEPRKKSRHRFSGFNPDWLYLPQFSPWLYYTDHGMFCRPCQQFRPPNKRGSKQRAFLEVPAVIYRKDYIERHIKTQHHQESVRCQASLDSAGVSVMDLFDPVNPCAFNNVCEQAQLPDLTAQEGGGVAVVQSDWGEVSPPDLLKMENASKSQDMEDSQSEQGHNIMDQPPEHYAANTQDHTEGYTAGTGKPGQPCTAEIDVELSESEEEDSRPVKKWPNTEDEEVGSISCTDIQHVYLGNPDRKVMIPQYAMIAALQRMRPELAVRVLIKYMFPEEVLVASNVYGNAELGKEPLDPNKIAAVREHLQERFPLLMLDEDGQDWKLCVGAINSTIRKFRHELKVGRPRKKGI